MIPFPFRDLCRIYDIFLPICIIVFIIIKHSHDHLDNAKLTDYNPRIKYPVCFRTKRICICIYIYIYVHIHTHIDRYIPHKTIHINTYIVLKSQLLVYFS